MKKLTPYWAIVLCLSGCNQASNEEPAQKPEEHKALYNAVNPPLEKARNVEQQLLEQARQQSEDIDRATSANP